MAMRSANKSTTLGRFTLIELLVVVAIIAVLASMLLPALQTARAKARSGLCMANQRQFLPAIMGYMEDHGEWLPAGTYDPLGRHMPLWSGAVAHYAGFSYYTEWTRNAITHFPIGWKEPVYVGFTDNRRNSKRNYPLKCPSENFRNVWGTQLAVSYGWNGAPYAMGSGDGFLLYSGSYPASHGRITMNRVIYPSGTVMTGDYVTQHGRYEYYYGNSYAPFSRHIDHFATYHGGGANIAWADGHVSNHKLHEMVVADFRRDQTR